MSERDTLDRQLHRSLPASGHGPRAGGQASIDVLSAGVLVAVDGDDIPSGLQGLGSGLWHWNQVV
jgi:hypothetical protein